jgi:hypothetical protein
LFGAGAGAGTEIPGAADLKPPSVKYSWVRFWEVGQGLPPGYFRILNLLFTHRPMKTLKPLRLLPREVT